MAQSDKSSSFFNIFNFSSYAPVATTDDPNAAQLQPSIGQILRSKRVRFLGAAGAITLLILLFVYTPSETFDEYLHNPLSAITGPSAPSDKKATPIPPVPDSGVDWSRFAYTQYATNSAYLCNSVMIFETLHRLGSKADRLLMYPASMKADPSSDNADSKLLIKAQKEYGVKLQPIEVQHRDGGDPTWADSYTKLLAFNQTQYSRVLSLDSDSTILQPMDELFLIPQAPVAMPRAYWLSEESTLSSQIVLIQPTSEEFTRVKNAIDSAKGGDFDMEIVNDLYGRDCMILPHRMYDLLTGEFRNNKDHRNYLGNDYEEWDPEKILAEAKFLHFSDWPMPKPWLSASSAQTKDVQPECVKDKTGKEDCRARDIWLGFYTDFKERRKNVCDIDVRKVKARSSDVEIRPLGRFEYNAVA